MKNKIIYKLMLTIFIVLGFFDCQSLFAQEIPDLNAHYPLRSRFWNDTDNVNFQNESYNEFDVFDISGRAKHGTLKGYSINNYGNNNETRDDFYVDQRDPFRGAPFPNFDNNNTTSDPGLALVSQNLAQMTCTYKAPSSSENQYDDVYLEIPRLTSSGNGRAVMFWIYHEHGQNTINNNIIELDKFEVLQSGDKLRILTHDDKLVEKQIFRHTGWHAVLVSVKETVNEAGFYDIQVFSQAFSKEDLSPLRGVFADFGGFEGNLPNDNSPSLLREFTGYIWNVKIFDKFFNNPADFENMVADDIKWAKGELTSSNSVSNSYHYYNFEGSSYLQDRGRVNNNLRISGNISRTSGKSGTANTAIKINSGYLSFTRPLGETYDYTKGFTFSFWTKIDEDYSNVPYSIPDWTNGRHILQAKDRGSGQTIFGLERFNEVIGINRYSPLSGEPWVLWPYNPADFTSMESGWYNVIISFRANYFEIFVLKPGNDPVTMKRFNAWNEYYGMHDQTRLATTAIEWSLGGRDGSSIEFLDDVRFYNWPLSYSDAKALANYSAPDPDDQIEFAIIGDFGCDGGYDDSDRNTNVSGYEWLNGNTVVSGTSKIASMVKNWNPQFIVTLGDNDNQHAKHHPCANNFFDNVGKYYGEFISSSNMEINRFFPALGNHDFESAGQVWDITMAKNNYNDHYGISQLVDLDNPYYIALADVYDAGFTGYQNDDINYGGRFYTFKKGSIRFFILNSNYIPGDLLGSSSLEPHGIGYDPNYNASSGQQHSRYSQAYWLREALNASHQSGDKYQIVIAHHPPITSSRSDEYATNMLQQWPLYDWGVDAVISGDDHWFEHFEYNPNSSTDKLDYIVAGTGGFPGLPYRKRTLNPGYDPSYPPSGASLQKSIDGRFGALYAVEHNEHLELTFSYVAQENMVLPYDAGGNYTIYPDYIEDGTYSIQIMPRSFNSTSARISNEEDVLSLEEDPYSFNLYPNPSTGSFKINLEAGKRGILDVRVVSLNGAIVYEDRMDLLDGDNSIEINLPKGLRTGLYLVEIDDGISVKKRKLIVE